MITTAPLPLLADLGRVLRGASAGIAPWLKPWDTGLLSPRSSWSLAAIAAAIAKRQGLPPRILLPGWICNQSLWPLRRMGAELLFLPVRPDGAMDWAVAETLGSLDMVVVVHPFGFPAALDAARDFANRRGALLVEDAAHCLIPGPGLHESGDVVLYSPHKLVATPAGGVIAVRPRAESWADAIATELGQPPQAANDWRWLARRLVQAGMPDALRPMLPQGGQPDFASDPATVALGSPLMPSVLARRLLAARDLEAEAARRRDNDAALRGIKGLTPLFPAGDWTPYRFAFRPIDPAATYARLRAARLPVETWPDLPPEVKADPRHQAGAVALRDSVLLLPVHGALDPDRLIEAYAEVLS